MLKNDPTNTHFQLAVKFINQTGQHLFLTGKAGTGKTTFLKYIKDNCLKKLAVVAPTGVAAINAGGVTLHSLFQLPFGPFLPTRKGYREYSMQVYNDINSLLQHVRFTADKRELLQELDLLIIDEISMVRADTLDAIDIILRHVRRRSHLPFGGVQMVYIGDLHQLPPVVGNDDWNILKDYYNSPFFFDALVLSEAAPTYLELKKIYRQSDIEFINILNHLRTNTTTTEDLEFLKAYYNPHFQPNTQGEYITLTTHNNKAEIINNNELQKLKSKVCLFNCEIKGEFNEKALPAERVLQLKEGAQIMFIKNDKGEIRRYYNGKIGIIQKISDGKIFVTFPNDDQVLQVEKETWRNIRYVYNKETDLVEEEELGTFVQFPIRLAWAITIHKSQGLTFDKAIIDAGDAFAPGQVYVALSRLTSLDGLVLLSRIQSTSIKTDERVVEFNKNEVAIDELSLQLRSEQSKFITQLLVNAFDWSKLDDKCKEHQLSLDNRSIAGEEGVLDLAEQLFNRNQNLQQVFLKFENQLSALISQAEEDGFKAINERVNSASKYFSEAVETQLVLLDTHQKSIKATTKTKRYLKDLNLFVVALKRKQKEMEHALLMAKGLLEGTDPQMILDQAESNKLAINNELINAVKEIENKAKKPPKGETQRISLTAFKEGKSIEDIALERGLSPVTIMGHLNSFIPSREINILEILSQQKLDTILKLLEAFGDIPTGALKEKLGDDFSYADIKAVQNYQELLFQQSNQA